MDRNQRVKEITLMCDEHGCSDKVRKIHFDQYVDRGWHPHPPQSFIAWWKTQHEYTVSEVQPKPAWNCACYRDKFNELRSVGAV